MEFFWTPVALIIGRGPSDFVIGTPYTVINKFTSRSRSGDPEYCLLSENWNSVGKKNPQQILVLCTFGFPLD